MPLPKIISSSASLLDAAVKYSIIDKKGAWYTWGDEKVGQGRENAKLYLEQNPDAAAAIEKVVREKIFQKNASPADLSKSGPAAGAAAPRSKSDVDGASVISADDLF
jgi:recombination protein RecA